MIHEGSCHCRRIRFRVEGDIQGVISCNCSICQRKGALMWFVGRDKLRLLTPDGNASTYMFNKHVIKHRFCANCGIHAFGEGEAPGGGKMAAVNLRTLEDFDVASVPVKHYDGRSH